VGRRSAPDRAAPARRAPLRPHAAAALRRRRGAGRRTRTARDGRRRHLAPDRRGSGARLLRRTFPVPSLYLPCTFRVPSL
jgi:hypothetical protein